MRTCVILGGGYGGMTILRHLLDGALPSDLQLILIDRMPYQGLKTEYYALASGTVSDLDVRVAFPVHPQVTYRYGEVHAIHIQDKRIELDQQESISFDDLIVGLGCVDKFHGLSGAEEHTHTIQTMSATRRTYQAVNDVKPYGHVQIIGGGLSGVEMAAELRESRPDLNVAIIERNATVLSSFPKKLSEYVEGWFKEHEVHVQRHIRLHEITRDFLIHETGEIATDATIWTGGIQPSLIVQSMNLAKDNYGRIQVNAYHQVPTNPYVYVVGDCASLPFSPSAQAAQQQGKQIAEVLLAVWNDRTPRLSSIKLKGVLGSLGKKAGFGTMGKNAILGKLPRSLKNGVLWMSKHHFG